MKTAPTLEQLIKGGAVWRGGDGGPPADRVIPSGLAELDECIGGGWPRGSLTELLSQDVTGLSLLLPAMAALSHGARWLVWIDPPYLPYAPVLRQRGVNLARLLVINTRRPGEALWAAEQAMSSGACGAVLLWPHRVTPPQVRRLQLAAEQGDCLAVLFRPLAERSQSSHAALRLQVGAGRSALAVNVLKRRGGRPGGGLRLAL